VTSGELLHVIVREGVEASLLPLGFKPTDRRLTWSRPANEVNHLIGLLAKGKRYTIQWSVGCAPAARLLWGDGNVGDISYAVMAGIPSDLIKPAFGDGFALTEDVTDENVHDTADGIATDLAAVAQSLERFQTVRGLWRYLMANRDPVDRRDFSFPTMFPMKIAAATALALVGGDREGCELMPEARVALTQFREKLSLERLERLEDAARAVCA